MAFNIYITGIYERYPKVISQVGHAEGYGKTFIGDHWGR